MLQKLPVSQEPTDTLLLIFSVFKMLNTIYTVSLTKALCTPLRESPDGSNIQLFLLFSLFFLIHIFHVTHVHLIRVIYIHSENIYSPHLWSLLAPKNGSLACLVWLSVRPLMGWTVSAKKGIIFPRWDFARLECIWEKRKPKHTFCTKRQRLLVTPKFHLSRIDCITLIFWKTHITSARSKRSLHLLTLNSSDDGCRRWNTASSWLVNAPEGIERRWRREPGGPWGSLIAITAPWRRHQTLLGTNRTQGRLLSGTEVISVDSWPDPCWLSTSGNTTEAVIYTNDWRFTWEVCEYNTWRHSRSWANLWSLWVGGKTSFLCSQWLLL